MEKKSLKIHTEDWDGKELDYGSNPDSMALKYDEGFYACKIRWLTEIWGLLGVFLSPTFLTGFWSSK